jgi:NNP family nitrate/nitrite transporter-like MFS transporter
MDLNDFRRSGHVPTLFSAFLYFCISSMAWMMVGALANSIAADLGNLSGSQKGLMVAVPLLGGAVLRLVLGVMTDHMGARKTAMIGLCLTVIPMIMGWLWADSFLKVLAVGLLLGVAGASFAAALPLAGRRYPPRYQGLVLGIAGAGNAGTALATFFGSWSASVWGWHATFGLMIIPVLSTLILFTALAKDSPSQPKPRMIIDYTKVLHFPDTGWFCLFYGITFGGFVGLVSFLSIFFHDQYAVSNVSAGAFAALCAITGSLMRPVGGYLADRFGGISLLKLLFAGVAALMIIVSMLPSLGVCAFLLVMALSLLGMGNAAVFQLVPQRFPQEIGVITGIIGAAGGLGGFLLPTVLGSLKQITASYGGGFLSFAAMSLVGAICVGVVGRRWEAAFLGRGGIATTARSMEPVLLTKPIVADVPV